MDVNPEATILPRIKYYDCSLNTFERDELRLVLRFVCVCVLWLSAEARRTALPKNSINSSATHAPRHFHKS
ncbi:MAG: hypothetical protein ACI8ZW_000270 [Yoonia sp.]|jgi:hypothetical protein